MCQQSLAMLEQACETAQASHMWLCTIEHRPPFAEHLMFCLHTMEKHISAGHHGVEPAFSLLLQQPVLLFLLPANKHRAVHVSFADRMRQSSKVLDAPDLLSLS